MSAYLEKASMSHNQRKQTKTNISRLMKLMGKWVWDGEELEVSLLL